MVLTAQQWARRGYRIRTGARSYMRGAGGSALFSYSQVTPWEYVPKYSPRVNHDRYITVDGRLYKQV